MTNYLLKVLVGTLCVLVFGGQSALAAVSADEAAKLKTTLTPFGGEKAGNKDGTIPAWNGGIAPSGPRTTGQIPMVFPEDKPLFTITAKNMDQYESKLDEGTKALMKKYPDTYALNVYVTRRTAAAPQWVYDNTFKNATHAKIVQGPAGPYIQSAVGGVPFPIPKTGEEVMWNHLLRWNGASLETTMEGMRVTPEGKVVSATSTKLYQRNVYYDRGLTAETFDSTGEYSLIRTDVVGPPLKAGEINTFRFNVDDDKTNAWTYLTGQRRVRRSPLACCDVPSPTSSGATNLDEAEGFLGRLGRYDWKIIGKKEIYVPYNTNMFHREPDPKEVFGPKHANPKHVRWELHRVWVLDASLKQGERHVSPKGRFYVDEDNWNVLLANRFDAQGQLWKVIQSLPSAFPDLPGVSSKSGIDYDMLKGGYYSLGVNKSQDYRFTEPKPSRAFTPDAMSGESVR